MTQPEEPNTVATALNIWATGAAIILSVILVIPTALFALWWIAATIYYHSR